jgi:SlyX protein
MFSNLKGANGVEMDKKDEDRFVAIETKFAYEEQFVSDLQIEVVEQGKKIQKLSEELKLISEKLRDVLDSQEDIPNRRPPHY